MSTVFIWGAGGVGKTHLAIRKAALADRPSLLLTLDPSQRVYDLLSIDRKKTEAQIKLDTFDFMLKRTDQAKLFSQLSAKSPANPKVKIFYDQMVKGLQDFRDYLTLIQLSDDLQASEFKTMIIDTPPFQEAVGLHRSLFHLRHFFEKSLVQFALKTANISWVHGTVKKMFEVARVFSGKKAADQIFEFIDWLTHHSERFSLSARYLEELVYSRNTRHLFAVTPETPVRFLDSVHSFFEKSSQIEFVINRSVQGFVLPKIKDSFVLEIESQKELEKELLMNIRKKFPKSPVEQIPLILMGEDTEEELLRFIRTDPTGG